MRYVSVTQPAFPVTGLPHLRSEDLKALILSIIILLVTVLASRVASGRLRGALERGGFQVNVAILLARSLWTAMWIIGILLVLNYAGIGLTPLAAFIGVVGLAASLSLQQVLQNLVAGIYLLAERPFSIGDFIAVVGPSALNHEGTVLDIQMRTTHLRSRDDEVILVPNSAIFSGVVTNRSAIGGFSAQVTIACPRDIDPAVMRRDLLPVLNQIPSVLSTPSPELRVDKAGVDTWSASLLFWATSRDARSDAVWAIAHAFPNITVNEVATP